MKSNMTKKGDKAMKTWPKLVALCVLTLPAALPAQWAKLSSRAAAGSVLATPDGGSILVGNNLTKLSADGQVVWGKIFDMNDPGQGGYIRAWLNEDGGCLAARAVYADSTVTLFQLSSLGAVEWQKKWPLPNSVADSFSRTTDGGVILAGSTTLPIPSSEEADIILCKASSTGEIEWQRSYGTAERSEWVFRLATAADGGYFVVAGSALTANPSDRSDLWVLKLSTTGEIEWQELVGGAAGDVGDFISQTADGGCLIIGRTASFSEDLQGRFWFLKLSSTGAVERQHILGYRQSDYWGDRGPLVRSMADGSFMAAIWSAYDVYAPDPPPRIRLLALSSDGEILRQRAYPMAYGNLQGVTFTPTAEGGALLALAGSAGLFDFNTDVQLLRLGPSGDIEWQKIFGSDYSEDAVVSLHQMSDGDFFFVGSTASWAGGGSWYMRLTPDGSLNPYCVFVKSANSAVMEETSSPTEVEATVVNTSAVPLDIGGTAEPGNIGFGFVTQGDFPVLGTLTATLTMVANGGTTTPANGLHVYDTGTRVMLSASPSRGYIFSSWFGNIYVSQSPVSVLMDGDKKIVANYSWVGWDDDGGGGSGCFIATAAFGSALDPHVETLRAFRDKYLLKSRFGKAIVNLYYKLSPPLARLIASDPILRAMSQVFLYPLVLLSQALL
jgi:hypothetical protein